MQDVGFELGYPQSITTEFISPEIVPLPLIMLHDSAGDFDRIVMEYMDPLDAVDGKEKSPFAFKVRLSPPLFWSVI